jgi:ketosteroid isomerase-like protein
LDDTRDDEAAVAELNRAWNDAYVRNDRSALAHVLADDFVATGANGETVTKAQLIAGGGSARVTFSEHVQRMFGPTAIVGGRIRVERDAQTLEQRFVRVYAKRDARWQAVAVQVFPVVG